MFNPEVSSPFLAMGLGSVSDVSVACWRQVGRFEVAGFSSPGEVTSASRNFTVPVGTLWEEKVGDGWATGEDGDGWEAMKDWRYWILRFFFGGGFGVYAVKLK